jgi:hypothetical protein
MNGRGSLFQSAIHDRMSASRDCTDVRVLRRIFCSVRNPNQRTTWLIQDEPVGVQCMWKRGCFASQARTTGVLWVP